MCPFYNILIDALMWKEKRMYPESLKTYAKFKFPKRPPENTGFFRSFRV